MNNPLTFWDYFERFGPWVISFVALLPSLLNLRSQIKKTNSEVRKTDSESNKINVDSDSVTSETWKEFSAEIRGQLQSANETIVKLNKDQEELRIKYNDLLVKYTTQEQTIIRLQGENQRMSDKIVVLENEKEGQRIEILNLTRDKNNMSGIIIEQQQKILQIEKNQNKKEG